MKVQRKSNINIVILMGVFAIHVCFTCFTSGRKTGPHAAITESRFMIVTLVPAEKIQRVDRQAMASKKNWVEKKLLPFGATKIITSENNNKNGTLEIPEIQQQPIPDEFRDEALLPPAQTILEQAKHNIAKIDKEVRGKIPPVPAEQPESRFSRLAQGFEQAYVGSNSNDTRSYYESPEGIFYFMETVRGQKKCSMSGASGSPSGLSRGPVPIKCPTSENWKKY